MPIVETKKTAVDFLVEYLSPYKKVGPEKVHLTRVDDHYIHGVWDDLVVKKIFFNQLEDSLTKRLLSYDDESTLRYYLDDTSDPSYWKYYRRKEFIEDGEVVYKYRREDTYQSDTYIELPGVILVEFDLEDYSLHGWHSVYFDNSLNAMYLRTTEKVDARYAISYDSDDFKLPNHHTFKMDFIDEEGWGGSGWDQFWKTVFNGLFNSLIDNKDRKMHLIYSPGSGRIPFYPQLIKGSDLQPYRLIYPFLNGNQNTEKLGDVINANFSLLKSLETSLENNAILLEFKSVYGLFAFTKFLYFDRSVNSTISDGGNKKYRQFFDAYSELVKETFREVKDNVDKLFKLFFFLPSGAIQLIGEEDLWEFVMFTTQQELTNVKTDKEDIVVKILETLSDMYPRSTDFLNEFLTRQVNKIPLIEHLTYRLDGYNFTKFVELIRERWKTSDYAKFDETVNPALNLDGTSPIMLPYKSDKTLGFHHDNATIKWTDNYEAIGVLVSEPIIQIEGNEVEEVLIDLITTLTAAYSRNLYAYHPFAPLAILSEDNPEFIFNDADQQGGTFQIMPAFVLFAREQRAFWSNMATAGEYAADILSFLSGYGNILKAGKLFKIFKAGEKLVLRSKTFTKLAIGARRASGYMEMTAGVGNALLKLTGARETEWGKKISEVLFYLELAALSGEITAALHGSIKKASIKALEDSEQLNKVLLNAQETILKNADTGGDLKKTKELLEAQDDLAAIRQLEEFAGVDEAYKAAQHLDNFTKLRNKFHQKGLIGDLWNKRIVRKLLFKNNLKKMYYKYLNDYPNLQKGFNQAEFKTTILNKGVKTDEVLEYSISGSKKRLSDAFGTPPKLPSNTIDILDDYEEFLKFVEGAVDFSGRSRKVDSEIKYVFNFIKNHMNKGDEFIIETRNIFKTCDSCKRELLMLEHYLNLQGKKVKIVVFSNDAIEGTGDLKKFIK